MLHCSRPHVSMSVNGRSKLQNIVDEGEPATRDGTPDFIEPLSNDARRHAPTWTRISKYGPISVTEVFIVARRLRDVSGLKAACFRLGWVGTAAETHHYR